MSRRDTIIVAVLINTGLLLILFVTAINTKEDSLGIFQDPIAMEEKVQNLDITPQESESKSTAALAFEKPNDDSQALALKKETLEEENDAPLAQAAGDFVEVSVKRGDVLEKIARSNGVTVSEIMKANSLVDSRLDIGQVLKIPLKKEAPQTALQEENKDDELYYTVRSGDNPWLIAMRNRIDLEELLKINNLDEKKARFLKPGDKLRIR